MAKPRRRGCSGCLVLVVCSGLAYFAGSGSQSSNRLATTQNPTNIETQPTPLTEAPIDEIQPRVVLSPRTTSTQDSSLVQSGNTQSQTYYTLENANGRECPRTTCTRVMTIAAGTAVSVTGTSQGEAVSGTTTWVKVIFDGREMFIHGSLLSANRPPPRPTNPPVAPQPTAQQQQLISTPVPPPPAPSWNCSGDIYNCSSLTCAEIRSYTAACPGDPSNLDGNDNDGRYCESKCG